MNEHDLLLDDIAMLALDALSPAQAAHARAHLATCEECAAEYRRLRSAIDLLPLAAADPDAAEYVPRAALKARVMAITRSQRPLTAKLARSVYLLTAACFALAVIFGALYAGLRTQVNQQNAVIADLTAPAAQHYRVTSGEVIRSEADVYLVMRSLPALPVGKVYQAWTLPKGSKRMAPSVTFMPARGRVLVRLPVNAKHISAVAVSVEPAGGSTQPTSKPVFVVLFRG